MISSPEGTIYVGSSPNLNCTVDLNQAVNVPVTVNAMWTGPVLTTITPTSPLMESLSRYIIMGIVDVARSGNYTCQATVSSSDSSHFTSGGGTMSASTTIIVGMLLLLSYGFYKPRMVWNSPVISKITGLVLCNL